MADQSQIEWTDATWNPTTGCTKVSAGCKCCYAETLAHRLQAMGSRNYAAGFRLTLQPHMLKLPLRWPARRRMFVNSMSDVFHQNVPEDYIDEIFRSHGARELACVLDGPGSSPSFGTTRTFSAIAHLPSEDRPIPSLMVRRDHAIAWGTLAVLLGRAVVAYVLVALWAEGSRCFSRASVRARRRPRSPARLSVAGLPARPEIRRVRPPMGT